MKNNTPELMRQIAGAMERNPDGWWRGFEWVIGEDKWNPCLCERDAVESAATGKLRPRPRTIRIDVEVPEPMREVPEDGQRYWVLDGMNQSGIQWYDWNGLNADQRMFNTGIWATEHEAQRAADAIFGALGRTV